MAKNYGLVALLSVIFAALIILNAYATTNTNIAILKTNYQAPQGAPLVEQSATQFALSPANQVGQYNTQNALWLTTCPNYPRVGFAFGAPLALLTTNPNSNPLLQYGDWKGSGNHSDLPRSNNPQTVNMVLTVNSLPPIINALPSSATEPQVNLDLQNAVRLVLSNIGYTPQVSTGNGNFVSTAYNTKTNIFDSIPVSGQQGLWTWYGLSVDAAKLNDIYRASPYYPLIVNTRTDGNTYTTSNPTCSYTYSIITVVTLKSIGDLQAPLFPTITAPGVSGPVQSDIIPYLIYNARITNPESGNQFNTAISYDIYSPQNYPNAFSGSIDPFPLNSLPLFFSGTTQTSAFAGNLVYYSSSGVSYQSATANQIYGLKYPYASATASTPPSGSGGGGSGTCNPSAPSTLVACLSAKMEAQSGGSFLFTPQFITIQIQGAEQLGNTYGFPWEYVFAQMTGAECRACAYSEYPGNGDYYDEGQGNPTSSQNCFNWWSRTPGGPSGPSSTGEPPQGIEAENFPGYGWRCWSQDSGGAYDIADFNTNPGVPGASGDTQQTALNSYTAASAAIIPYYSSTINNCYGPGCGTAIEDTCNFDTWAEGTYAIGKPIEAEQAYATTIRNQIIALFGSIGNVQAAAGAGTGNGQSPCVTPDPVPANGGSGGGGSGNNPIIQLAIQELGVPYLYGGDTPSGFDCSGLVYWIYTQLGYKNFPRLIVTSSPNEWNDPALIQHISQGATAPGDLVWFWSATDPEYLNGKPAPGHVGICINQGCTGMINAPYTGCLVSYASQTNSCGSQTPVMDGIANIQPCPTSGTLPSFCIMGYGHVLGAPTGQGGSSTSQPNVFTTSLAVNSIAAMPNGYIFVLGTQPTGAPQQEAIGCVSAQATKPEPSNAKVTGGGTAYYTETVTSSSPPQNPSFPLTFNWYTGHYTGPGGGANTCPAASCPSNTDCNPVATHSGVSGYSDTVGINVGNTNQQCDVWVDVQTSCSGHYSYSGNAYFGSTQSSGPPTSTSPNPTSPSGSTTPAAATQELYILKATPPGQFNASEYQPNTVLQTTDQGTYTTNWNTYWSNLMKLQGSSVYVVGADPYMADQALINANFVPENLTTDQLGDVYITGYNSLNVDQSYLVEIANAIGPGPSSINIQPLCNAYGQPISNSANPYMCQFQWTEIAASPTGAQVYLANPQSGIIPIFDGSTLQYEYAMNLSYSTDNSILSGPEGVAASPLGYPAANIIDYFQSGGFYGINPQCGTSNPKTDPVTATALGLLVQNFQIPQGGFMFLSGPQPCTPNGAQLKLMLDLYYNWQPPPGDCGPPICVSNQNPRDVLDKASYDRLAFCSNPIDCSNINSNYHHPLSIQDVNGYLYILD